MSKLVAPSILSADFANLERDIQNLQKAGADWIHVDVMDGHFVPNLTIGAPVVAALKKVTTLPLDVHLMIERPDRYIADFMKAGADLLTIHVEASSDVSRDLQHIKSLGGRAGLTLKPKTSLDCIIPFLPLCDLVLVMTVEPGFGGQSFMPDQVAKLEELKALRQKMDFSYFLEVDGGINAETARQAAAADVFVAGSYVFKNDLKTAIDSLKQI
ncbi:MAG: ribulose-phosphate 3-epimerase [Bdellovibrionia bacterium]